METLPNLSPSSEMESVEQQKQWLQQEETEEEAEEVVALQVRRPRWLETEEEAEEVVALQVRRPRWWKTTATTTTTTTTTTIGGSDVSSSDVMLPSSEPTNGFQEGYDYPQEKLKNGSDNKEGNDVQEDSQESLERNVHYDKDQGIWKCRKCIWTYKSGSPWIDHTWRSKWYALMLMNAKTENQGGQCFFCETEGTESNYQFSVEENSGIQGSASEKNPGDKGLVVTINIFDSQKSQDTVNNQQYKENLKEDSFSDLELLSSEKSPEDDKTNSSFSEIATTGDDIELIKDIDEELTEFDVERVLEKQNTHDLYCPNCNSCITRRVILRKRKRKVKFLGEDTKRNKLETVVASELDSISATNDQDSNGQTPAVDDCNRPREREIFSCLSCFSIFIPTGKGFKLFKIFGDKSEKENMQSPQPISAVKNNWFSSTFVSRKEDMLIEQRSIHKVDVNENIVGASKQEVSSPADVNENIVGESKQEVKSPPQSFGAQGVEKSSSSGENREGGDDIVPASTPGSELSGKVIAGVGEKSVDAMKNVKDDTKPVSVPGESDNKEIVNIVPDLPSANGQKVGAISPNASVVTSPPQSFGAQGVEKSSSSGENREGGDDIVPASAPGSELSGNVIAGVGEKSVDAMKNGKVSVPGESDNNETVNIEPDLPSANGQKVEAVFPTGSVVEDKNVKIQISGTGTGSDIIITVRPDEPAASQEAHDIITQEETEILPTTESVDTRGFQGVEIVKSMVYGGLMESITSLGVVSSAAGANATTLNIVALGLANLIGGLFIIGHQLWDLKNDYSARTSNQITGGVSHRVSTKEDRYQDLLGRRENFWIHAVVAILSFLIFGSLPPVIYGFSFHASNNRDYKLLAVAAASLLCIIMLTAGKVYIQRPPKSYIKTVIYFVIVGSMASVVSYAAGKLINKLLENLGWSGSGQVLTLPVLETTPMQSTWQSY